MAGGDIGVGWYSRPRRLLNSESSATAAWPACTAQASAARRGHARCCGSCHRSDPSAGRPAASSSAVTAAGPARRRPRAGRGSRGSPSQHALRLRRRRAPSSGVPTVVRGLGRASRRRRSVRAAGSRTSRWRQSMPAWISCLTAGHAVRAAVVALQRTAVSMSMIFSLRAARQHAWRRPNVSAVTARPPGCSAAAAKRTALGRWSRS